MGVRVATLAVAAVVAGSPAASGVHYLQSRQLENGGFAEPGATAYPQLTAWATLGLRAAGVRAAPGTSRYLASHEAELTKPTDLALVAMAEAALGQQPDTVLARLRSLEQRNGSFGGLVNGTAWAVLALRTAERPVHAKTIRWLLARQARSGGWGWNRKSVDSNDTAAVVEALRAVGVHGRPIRRALHYLGTYRNRDGGFELTHGRGSDAQSTAWVIQAYLAAGKRRPRAALAYLRRLQQPDGSFRYSLHYVATPVWVTSQVIPAVVSKPFPLG